MTKNTLLAAIFLLFPIHADALDTASVMTGSGGVKLINFSKSFVEWDNIFAHKDESSGVTVERNTTIRAQIIAIAEILDLQKKVKKRFLLLERYQGEKMWAKDFIFYQMHSHSYSFFFIADAENCEFMIIRNPVLTDEYRYQYNKCGYDGKNIITIRADMAMENAIDVTSRQQLQSAVRLPRQLIGVSEKADLRLIYPLDSYNYYIEDGQAVPQFDIGEIIYFRDNNYALKNADIAFLGYNEDITEFNLQKPHTLKSSHKDVPDNIRYEYGDIRQEKGWIHKVYLLGDAVDNGHVSTK